MNEEFTVPEPIEEPVKKECEHKNLTFKCHVLHNPKAEWHTCLDCGEDIYKRWYY